MKQTDFFKIVKVMKATYPNERFLPDKETIEIWYSMLKDLSYEQVANAVKIHMATDEHLPTIASIRKKCCQVQQGDLGEAEAWELVLKAMRNSAYNSESEFQKLPKAVQKAVGSAATLKEWSLTENLNLQVESSNFKRAYRQAVESEKQFQVLPAEVRQRIESGLKMLGGVENDKNM